MASFTDYYTVLGIKASASTNEIKAAFKKLALQYHPDVYKGADAQERMRLLLLAYQTLSDADSRREYDVRRSEHVVGVPASSHAPAASTAARRKSEVTPRARRDRKRHYAFPDLDHTFPAKVQLGDVSYSLSKEQAFTLTHEGLLRGVAPGATESGGAFNYGSPPGRDDLSICYCHRCRHHWTPAPVRGTPRAWDRTCPSCGASDWSEYLLLRCVHCCAVFESEQIRYEIGGYNYGDGDLCPPYELFPLCPYCGSPNWCPAEDERVKTLRASAARRAARLRLLWLAVAIMVLLALGALVITSLPR